MNKAQPQPFVLGISTREIIFAFILAKLVATAAGAILASGHPEIERFAVTLGSTASMVFFVLLIMLGGRQSVREVIAATAVARKPGGNVLLWAVVAVLAGFGMRFGIGGLVLGTYHVVDPASIVTEIRDLAEVLNDATHPLDAIAYLLVLVDAANEEIVYRRILQNCFCGRFGLVAGVIGVAVAFGAVHGSVPIMLVGIWLGLLYLHSGRLWVAVLAHAAANLSVYAMAAMQRPATQGLFLVACYTSAVLIIAAMVLAALAVRRRPRRSDTRTAASSPH
jgi:membrane protease YdiL (CAAX protease family)